MTLGLCSMLRIGTQVYSYLFWRYMQLFNAHMWNFMRAARLIVACGAAAIAGIDEQELFSLLTTHGISHLFYTLSDTQQ